PFAALINAAVANGFALVLKERGVDPSKPGRPTLKVEDIEWVTCGLGFGRTEYKGEKLHSFQLGGLAVRTAAPFDWPTFLRGFRPDFTEVREGGRVYYKVTGRLKPLLGPNPCVYLPDDRTVVFDEEEPIRRLVRRETPAVPAYLAGPEWER